MRKARFGLVAGLLILVSAAAVAWWSRPPALHPPRDSAELATRVDRAVRAARGDRVPQAAVALVHDGRVMWTRGYGGARPDTPFQVGSISKPVAALGLLRLARERGSPAAAPVRVTGWTAPPGLTLQRLLSHTAGLSVDGYQGADPGRPLPTTLEELTGRGDGPAVTSADPAGTRLRYSGGGYTVAQLWGEQTARQAFGPLMASSALRPLAMSRSTFAQVPPPGAASAHGADGRRVPSYRYAALAAAGLWSTAADLGRLVAFLGSGDPIARAVRRPAPATDGAWGMGVALHELRGGRVLVEHEGVNRGWHARIALEPASGWGMAVLTNSDAGGDVADAALEQLVD